MPIHEYHCASCGADFDHLARRADDPPKACPKCGKPGGLSRRLSAFAAPRATPAAAKPAPCHACPGAPGCAKFRK